MGTTAIDDKMQLPAKSWIDVKEYLLCNTTAVIDSTEFIVSHLPNLACWFSFRLETIFVIYLAALKNVDHLEVVHPPPKKARLL